jgi:FG-GAP-like repeat
MDSTTTSFTPVSSSTFLTESFTGTTLGSRSWVLGTSRVNTNSPFLTAQSGLDTAGNGALRLTTTAPQQAGFALYNAPIATSGGLTIEFDLASYGGSGADGITFFLVDGSSAPALSGAPGGSLGYATSRYSDHPGLSGGYLAIGYDEFGGFSDPGNSAPGGPGNRPDSIALRGSAQNQYKYLTGTSTLPGGIDNPAANANRTNSTRRTKIDLTATGNLSVSIDLNGDQDYNDSGEAAIQNYNLVAANGALPGTIKFGFTASNGDQTNIHEIRNLTVGQSGNAPIPGGSFNIGGLSALTYTENQSGLTIAPTGTLTLGSKALETVSVRILGNYAAGQDRLTISGQTGTSGTTGGLTWDFNAATGTITLRGSGTAASYQSALRQVVYSNGSDNPATPPRTLEVALLASDGAITTQNVALNVIAVDDPYQLRVITQEGVQSGIPGATVGPVFVTDFDNTYSLTVSDSRFEIISNGPNTGILKLKEGQALTAPTTITITGTDNSVSPAITFSQPVEIGIFTIPNPSGGITIGGLNGSPIPYNTPSNPIFVARGINLSGGGGNPINGAVVRIVGNGFNGSQETLSISGQTGTSGTVNGLTWTYDTATGTLTFAGPGSLTTYQTALSQVTYSAAGGATGDRAIQFIIGTGANVGASNIVIVFPNNGSALSINGFPTGGFTYTPGPSPSPIAATVTLSGGTGSTISGATVSLSGPNFNLAQDRLGITGQSGTNGTVDGLTWVYNDATGILTLSGPGNTAAYQSALQKITYTNSSPAPATGVRSVTYTVTTTTTNGSSSASGAFSINVGSALPNSGLSGLGDGLNYTTGAAPGTIAAGLTVTAASGSQFNGATVSIGNNFNATQDRLGIAGQTGTSGTVSGLTWTYDAATGILTLSGPGDATAYQSALRQVTYSNSAANPSLLPRTLTFNLGGATGASGTAIVNFTTVNGAPTALALSSTSVGYAATGAIVGNLTTTDADSTLFNYTVSDPRFEILNGQLKLKAGQTIAAPTAVNITTYDGIIGAAGTQSLVQSFTLVPRLPEIFLRDYNTSADSTLFYINNASTLAGIRYLSLAGQTAAERFKLPTKWRAEAVGDLNRDGFNDVIYRNSTNGEQTAYIVFLGEDGRIIGQDFVKSNNTALSIANNATWQIKGLSDMNGDGTLDIIWHNATQDSTAIWYLPGTASTNLVSAAFLTRPGGAAATFSAPGTRLVGVGDFDGDGKAEFLYRNNATDRTTLWKLNGSEVAQEQVLIPTGQTGWEIKLVADFNNDGRADIAWQNTRLDTSATWLTAPATTTVGPIASTPLPGYFLPKPGANWSFEATADFNNDGTNDIVLRNKVTDTLRIWTIKDGQVLADNVIANGTSTFILGNPEWDVEGAGQFGATPA